MDKNSLKRFFSHNIRELSVFFVLILLVIFVNIRSNGNFLTPKNINDMFVESSVLIILTMGMMMVIITGGIDLSVGATMALAGMVSTSVLKNNMNLSPILIILIAIIVGLCAGAINGLLISVFNILPIIATLGTMNAYRGLTYLISDGSWVLQQDMSKEFMAIATGRTLGLNNLVIIAILVIIITYYFLAHTRTGRQIYAVGNSEESAAVSGINTKLTKLMSYTILGGLAGLAGVLYVCKYAAAQGETATGYELNVIAACVLGGVSIAGGMGKVYGAVLGAVLLGLLNNALPLLQISPFWQEALRGFIILASILVNAFISRKVAKKALERRALA